MDGLLDNLGSWVQVLVTSGAAIAILLWLLRRMSRTHIVLTSYAGKEPGGTPDDPTKVKYYERRILIQNQQSLKIERPTFLVIPKPENGEWYEGESEEQPMLPVTAVLGPVTKKDDVRVRFTKTDGMCVIRVPEMRALATWLIITRTTGCHPSSMKMDWSVSGGKKRQAKIFDLTKGLEEEGNPFVWRNAVLFPVLALTFFLVTFVFALLYVVESDHLKPVKWFDHIEVIGAATLIALFYSVIAYFISRTREPGLVQGYRDLGFESDLYKYEGVWPDKYEEVEEPELGRLFPVDLKF